MNTLIRTSPRAHSVTSEAPPAKAWGPLRPSAGRVVVICFAAIAVVSLAVFARPLGEQASPAGACVRTFLVVVLTTAVLVGPGLALRFYVSRLAGASVGWLILPGGALLAATGLLAWVLAAHGVPAALTSRVVLIPLTIALLGLAIGSLWRRGSLETGDATAFTIVLFLLLVGVGRDLYSVGVVGELYGGLVSRTYEATIIPDSRISYHTVQLVANGAPPYGKFAHSLLAPYNFSSRGPLPGLAAAPIVLSSGAQVPAVLPDQPWAPFDQQGFAAYRLAMETFAVFALLSLYSLMRVVSSTRTALFALVLAATTPFVVHEVYFTWPKLATAGMLLLSAEQVLRRRPLRAGLLVGLAYLLHPSGLFWLPALLILEVLWVWREEPSRRLRAIVWVVGLTLAGSVVVVAGWQLVNLGHTSGGHRGQGSFLEYPLEAAQRRATGFRDWADWRLQTLSDTLIPFHQFLTDSTQPYTLPPGQPARAAVRLGLGYWGTLPLGGGILFYPLLLFGLARAAIRYPFLTVGCIVLPFLAFVLYWGSVNLGLLQQGMHAWVLGTLAMYALVRSGSRWWPLRLERCILTLRVPEVGFMILFPAVWTQRTLISPSYRITDTVALAAMAVGLGGLMWCLWRVTDRAEHVAVSNNALSAQAEGIP